MEEWEKIAKFLGYKKKLTWFVEEGVVKYSLAVINPEGETISLRSNVNPAFYENPISDLEVLINRLDIHFKIKGKKSYKTVFRLIKKLNQKGFIITIKKNFVIVEAEDYYLVHNVGTLLDRLYNACLDCIEKIG